MLTREVFFRPQERRYVAVQTPLGAVRLQSLTNGEMRTLRQSLVDRKGDLVKARSDRINELLLCYTIVNDGGARLFSDEDAFSPAWDEMDGHVVRNLMEAAKRHTGFGADADWQAVEDAAKNSE